MRPLQTDLPAILSAVASGDVAAFERLYGLTSAKLFGVILRIVRNRESAEDVMQDVYVKVWQASGSYSLEAGRPMTWLIAIARNRAIDVVRRRREVAAPVREDGSDWLDDVPEPLDRETAFLDADRLSVCLRQLSEEHRGCFLLAYSDGLSREELSARFGRPVNTIKTWLHRSATTLRSCLSDER